MHNFIPGCNKVHTFGAGWAWISIRTLALKLSDSVDTRSIVGTRSTLTRTNICICRRTKGQNVPWAYRKCKLKMVCYSHAWAGFNWHLMKFIILWLNSGYIELFKLWPDIRKCSTFWPFLYVSVNVSLFERKRLSTKTAKHYHIYTLWGFSERKDTSEFFAQRVNENFQKQISAASFGILHFSSI